MSVERLLYPISEAAEALGVKRGTIYKLIKEGALETVHIGRRTLIPRESLDAYIRRIADKG